MAGGYYGIKTRAHPLGPFRSTGSHRDGRRAEPLTGGNRSENLDGAKVQTLFYLCKQKKTLNIKIDTNTLRGYNKVKKGK